MLLRIRRNVYEELVAAARAAAPCEACGLLGGVVDLVTKFYPLTNADASPEHFSMLPEEQFAAIKNMRQGKLKMLGIWHSHPSTPARMSEEDLRLAYTPDVIYVILSLAKESPTMDAYRVQDGVPQRVEVTVVEDGE